MILLPTLRAKRIRRFPWKSPGAAGSGANGRLWNRRTWAKPPGLACRGLPGVVPRARCVPQNV